MTISTSRTSPPGSTSMSTRRGNTAELAIHASVPDIQYCTVPDEPGSAAASLRGAPERVIFFCVDGLKRPARGDRNGLARRDRADLCRTLLRCLGYADTAVVCAGQGGARAKNVGIILLADRRLTFPSLER